jgi:nicotinamide riboside transporter PnuC
MMKETVEFIAVISAIASVYLYGNGWRYSGHFGLVSQIFWWLFTYMNNLNSMYILCFFMTMMHIRNIFKMNKKETPRK